MKQISIALVMIGMIHFSANAQATHSKNDINYKVCRAGNGYKICSGAYNSVREIRANELQTRGNYQVDNSGVTPLSKGRSKNDINYKVCLVNSQYKVCNPDEPLIQKTNHSDQIVGTESVNTGRAASLSMQQTNAYMGYTSKKRSNIQVVDQDNIEQQLNTEADGKDKVEHRNMNYNNGSVSIPPSDGGLSDH